jgi:RNA polymerase sigma-70 factor (ECF subfamily)
VSEASEDARRQQARERVAGLVRRTLKGDLEAFDELVGLHQRQATAVAWRLLNHREDALEVVQDAFLKAFDKLSTLGNPEQFAPWLMRIVSNLALNRRRRRAIRRTASLDALGGEDEGDGPLPQVDPQAPTPEQLVSGQELRERLGEAIDRLPQTQRYALVMFSLAKIPQKQIARELGISVQAVKWHVFAARRKLKEQFEEYL